ncbi:MAG: flagellar biosynthetic protein FliQ [Candidatus Melainabacteria bacterium]|nr:flagellar biosynthetic protein FliQ [Candidatus Melainabacteria bacterium]
MSSAPELDVLTQHLGEGLILSLILSMPAVLAAAGIGLVMGILQAVTQVQEQTLAAAPKILGVFAIILLGGGVAMTMMMRYMTESAVVAFNEIPQMGAKLAPPLPIPAKNKLGFVFLSARSPVVSWSSKSFLLLTAAQHRLSR